MSEAKLVYGVGINDATYQVSISHSANGKVTQIWRCKFYKTWADMLRRCEVGGREQAKYPSYKGCFVSTEWLSFLAFRNWMKFQSWQGNSIDKDILHEGNREYGPKTCVFVSSDLNNFLLGSTKKRGALPVGVYWHKGNNAFLARVRNPFSGEKESLGYFNCPNEAYEAWRKRKHELACIYADQQTDPRVASALRTRYAEANP